MFVKEENLIFFLNKAIECPLSYDHLPLSTPLSEICFTVFDTETTGFQVEKKDRLIEIGAVLVKGYEVIEGKQFQTYVNPNRQISREITELTSITNEMVDDAPQAIEAMEQFFSFIAETNSTCFVGHYVDFDMLVLKSELKRQKLAYRKYKRIDTLNLIGFLAPAYDIRDLERYAMSFNTRIYTRHSAIGDALTTAYLFVELLLQLRDRGIQTLGELTRVNGQ